MAISYKASLRNARLDALTTALTATSRVKIYTGAAPALTASPTGTLLATLTPANPFAAGSSAGVLTASAIASGTAAASGTPQYFRVIDGTTDDGTHTQMQGDAAVGSGSLNFASTITSGGTVSISSFVVTEGNP